MDYRKGKHFKLYNATEVIVFSFGRFCNQTMQLKHTCINFGEGSGKKKHAYRIHSINRPERL